MFRKALAGLLAVGAFASPRQANAKDKDAQKYGEKDRDDDREREIASISISSKGNEIAFEQTEIMVPFAEKISLTFSNEASKGSEILHNVAVLRPGTLEGFMLDLQASGYDAAKISKHPSILVITATLDPGGKETVIFSPKEPGIYPFICVMAGHADMLGMKGILNVRKIAK